MADEPKPEGAEPASGTPEPAKPVPEKKPAPAAKPPAAHAPPKPPPTMAATPWDSELTKELKDQFGEQISQCSTYLGQNFLICKPDAAVPLLEFLKLEGDFDYLVDLTAVDYP